MKTCLMVVVLVAALYLSGCVAGGNDYVPASSISRNGYARDGEARRQADGEVIKLWGFVDHANLYGDAEAQAILGKWWSGNGPSDTSWRFNLKAHADDKPGQSFAVHVPNDSGRDELLRRFLADAEAGKATRVFVTGRLYTFDAITNITKRTGLVMEVKSSQDILPSPTPAP